ALNVEANNRQLHAADFDRLREGCRNSSSAECQTINRMAGVQSGMPTEDPNIPASKVVANYDANSNVVSYVLIDRSTNQPTMIMEPLDYAAYRNAPPGTQAMMQLSPQYVLDFASSGLYASAGDSSRAVEHVIAGVTSRDYVRDVALGAAGATISAVSVTKPTVGANKTANVLDDIAINIHPGQQGKHIPGNNNFIPGRSTIDSSVNPQELLNGVHSGQYPVVGTGSRGQPIVDFGRPIGVDASSGLPTQYGTIHSGKSGAHIVPTNPTTVGGVK
ncbi:MAG: polymorphic toxin type 50 domain-containing protein, partial [Noviherbaspirillum sp.]